jgi:hypothetical protein
MATTVMPRSNFVVPTWCRVCNLTCEERKKYDLKEKEREATRVGRRVGGNGGLWQCGGGCGGGIIGGS